MLILNFLIAEKHWVDAKRPGIERGTVQINQPGYFKNALTLKKSQKMYLSNRNQKSFGEQALLLFSQEIRGCGFIPG